MNWINEAMDKFMNEILEICFDNASDGFDYSDKDLMPISIKEFDKQDFQILKIIKIIWKMQFSIMIQGNSSTKFPKYYNYSF